MTEQTLDQLVARYADLQARQAALVDQMNDVKNEIRERFDCGTYDAAGLKVAIREPNRTFDLDAAVDMLPEQIRPACQVTTYDAKLVKKYLAPAVQDLCYKPGAGKRVVSIS